MVFHCFKLGRFWESQRLLILSWISPSTLLRIFIPPPISYTPSSPSRYSPHLLLFLKNNLSLLEIKKYPTPDYCINLSVTLLVLLALIEMECNLLNEVDEFFHWDGFPPKSYPITLFFKFWTVIGINNTKCF